MLRMFQVSKNACLLMADSEKMGVIKTLFYPKPSISIVVAGNVEKLKGSEHYVTSFLHLTI